MFHFTTNGDPFAALTAAPAPGAPDQAAAAAHPPAVAASLTHAHLPLTAHELGQLAAVSRVNGRPTLPTPDPVGPVSAPAPTAAALIGPAVLPAIPVPALDATALAAAPAAATNIRPTTISIPAPLGTEGCPSLFASWPVPHLNAVPLAHFPATAAALSPSSLASMSAAAGLAGTTAAGLAAMSPPRRGAPAAAVAAAVVDPYAPAAMFQLHGMPFGQVVKGTSDDGKDDTTNYRPTVNSRIRAGGLPDEGAKTTDYGDSNGDIEDSNGVDSKRRASVPSPTLSTAPSASDVRPEENDGEEEENEYDEEDEDDYNGSQSSALSGNSSRDTVAPPCGGARCCDVFHALQRQLDVAREENDRLTKRASRLQEALDHTKAELLMCKPPDERGIPAALRDMMAAKKKVEAARQKGKKGAGRRVTAAASAKGKTKRAGRKRSQPDALSPEDSGGIDTNTEEDMATSGMPWEPNGDPSSEAASSDGLPTAKKRNQNRKSWDYRYNELKAYKDQHGHCMVPRSEGRLGIWVHGKRTNYQYYLKGMPRSCLNDDRVARLRDLGFVFERHVDVFKQRFEELREYKEAHGNLLIPKEPPHFPTLWCFLQKQKREYRQWLAKKKGPMTDSRAYALESLGFRELFNVDYELIKHAKKRRKTNNSAGGGGSKSSNDDSGGVADANKVSAEKKENGGNNSGGESSSANGVAVVRRSTKQWDDMFDEMKAYKLEHGNCLVPQAHGKLGLWAKGMRDKNSRNVLAKHKVAKLKSIGFEWEVRGNRWQARFEELKLFYEANGHCRPSPKNPDGTPNKLWEWCKTQKQAYANREAGRHSTSKMTDEKAAKLESIGFQFRVLAPRDQTKSGKKDQTRSSGKGPTGNTELPGVKTDAHVGYKDKAKTGGETDRAPKALLFPHNAPFPAALPVHSASQSERNKQNVVIEEEFAADVSKIAV